MVMALLEDRRDRCSGCGELRSETQATKKDDHGHTVALHVYDAEAVECAGCRAISVKAGDDKDNPHPSAQGYRVYKRT